MLLHTQLRWCWGLNQGLLCHRPELYQLSGSPPPFCFLFLFIHSFYKVSLGFGLKRNGKTSFFVYALQICPLDFSTHGSYDPVVTQVTQVMAIHYRPQLHRPRTQTQTWPFAAAWAPISRCHHGPGGSIDHPGQCHPGGSEVLGHRHGLWTLTRPWASTQPSVITGVMDMATAG